MAKKEENIVNKEVIRDRLDRMKNQIAEMEQNFENKVAEHPLKSVALSFGIGVAVGAVIALLNKRK